MQKTKNNYLTYLEQYSTQKKISKPSDDPIIAVRSLKYRSNMSELEQYVKKNIPDAMSWMDITEEALKQVNDMLTNMDGYFVQAAQDSYELEDRQTIIDTILQYKEFIYKQQLNQDYAGRYVFAGYRTDTEMLFPVVDETKTYSITENQKISEVSQAQYVYGGAVYEAGKSAEDYAGMAPELRECFKITLSYDKLDSTDDLNNPDDFKDYVVLSYTDESGTVQNVTCKTVSMATEPQNTAYHLEKNGVGEDGAIFIPETGEIVLGSSLYEEMKKTDGYTINYNKTKFDTDDVRPEHYFDCSMYDSITGMTLNYTKPSEQEIKYQINFSQMLTVNVLGNESISLGIGRTIDNIVTASNELQASKDALSAVEKRIKETSLNAVDSNGNNVVESLKRLKSELETEITLKTTILHKSFGAGLTDIKQYQNEVSTSLSDLGARYKRLQLTENKLDKLQVSYEDLLSTNEDVDIGEAYIKYTEADLLYQASLSATSKLLGNSLLDFI
jgi:flagellar hook-associated protein 3 FlgL